MRSFAFGVIHILITLIIGIILSIYILLDMPKIQRALRNVLPEGRREEISGLAENVGNVLGSFFRGQLLVALFVGVASAVGLTVIGIPFAAVVGLIAGVFNLVPLIGPFIGAIPAVILALLSDQPIDALWAGLWLLTVQQIDNHIISPNVMARTVKLHPITVMLALLAAGSLFGLFGMLLIVPSIATVKMLAGHFWKKRSVREAIVAAMPDGATPAVVADSVMIEDVRVDGEEVVVAEERTVVRKPVRKARAPAKRRTTRGSRAAPKRKRSKDALAARASAGSTSTASRTSTSGADLRRHRQIGERVADRDRLPRARTTGAAGRARRRCPCPPRAAAGGTRGTRRLPGRGRRRGACRCRAASATRTPRSARTRSASAVSTSPRKSWV